MDVVWWVRLVGRSGCGQWVDGYGGPTTLDLTYCHPTSPHVTPPHPTSPHVIPHQVFDAATDHESMSQATNLYWEVIENDEVTNLTIL